jgi:hypothetical protein
MVLCSFVAQQAKAQWFQLDDKRVASGQQLVTLPHQERELRVIFNAPEFGQGTPRFRVIFCPISLPPPDAACACSGFLLGKVS